MDKTVLKNLVVELRESGETYQSIAEHLKENYGIERTKQGISEMYKRALKEREDEQISKKINLDVVNVRCLCNSATETYETLKKIGIDVSYRQVLQIEKDEMEYITVVEQSIINRLASDLDEIIDVELEKDKFTYKNVRITDKRFGDYYRQACCIKMENVISEEAQRLYLLNKGKDKELMHTILGRFGLDNRRYMTRIEELESRAALRI